MYKKSILLVFCIILLCVSTVSAVSPFAASATSGLEIRVGVHTELKINTDYDFHVHVFNTTNGFPITSGISCYLHLYAPNGTHNYEGENSVVSHMFDYSWELDKGNFSDYGEHIFIAQCNDSVKGGAASDSFFVTPDGNPLKESFSSLYFIIILVLALFSILCVIICYKTEQIWLKVLTFYGAYIFTTIINYFLWVVTANSFTNPAYIPIFFKWLFYIQTVALFPIVVGTVIWYLWLIVYNEDVERMLKSGVPENEAYVRAFKNKKGKR